ncbi:hypothetical protein ACKWTF_016242 [Chironomus riparius]
MDKKHFWLIFMMIHLCTQISESYEYYNPDYGTVRDYEDKTATTDDSADKSTDYKNTTILNELFNKTSIESTIKDIINTSTVKWSTLHNEDYINYVDFEEHPITSNTTSSSTTQLTTSDLTKSETASDSTTQNPYSYKTIRTNQDSIWTNKIIAVFLVVVIIFALVVGGLYAFSLFSLWYPNFLT